MKELMEHGGLACFGEELEERQIFKQGTVWGTLHSERLNLCKSCGILSGFSL